MKKTTRRRSTADEKAAILRQHLSDKVPMSNLAEEHGLLPSIHPRDMPREP